MKENDELAKLENEWQSRFDRFTVPEPTREQSMLLLEKIKGSEVEKPVDLRADLEKAQEKQSISAQMANLFLSQWNFHGVRSWLFTGIVMLILTITISQNWGSGETGFTIWIKWASLIMIAVISYAFRAKNEGNGIIEKLSYTPLMLQMFTRFLIVLVFQLVIAWPLSLIVLDETSSVFYMLSSFTPLIFFGVVGFVGTLWLGQKLGVTLALIVWFGQVLLEDRLNFASLFQVPGDDNFLLMNLVILGISCLLLSSMMLKSRQLRNRL